MRKLTEQQIKNVEAVLKTKGFKKCYPFLAEILKDEMLENGTTYKFDSWGFCRELSDEQRAKMEALEDRLKEYNGKVLFVLESHMQDPYGDKFDMDNYVYVTDEDRNMGLSLDTQTGKWQTIAHVHNKTWDESESGYILVKEVVGTMRRLG